MRRLLLVPVALLVALILGLSLADAARLPLSGGSLLAFAQSRCTNATLTVKPYYTAYGNEQTTTNRVEVRDLPAANCQGRSATVRVYNRASGANVFTATTAAGIAGTSFILTGATFEPVGDLAVLVTVDGWVVPSTWVPPISCVSLDDPAKSCWVSWTIAEQNQTTYDLDLSIRSTDQNVRWSLSMDLSQLVFEFVPNRINRRVGSNQNLTAVGNLCATLPLVTLQGTNSSQLVSSGLPVSATLRMRSNGSCSDF